MICHEKIVIFVCSVAIIVITKLAFDWFRRSLTRSSIFRAIFDLPKVQVAIYTHPRLLFIQYEQTVWTVLCGKPVYMRNFDTCKDHGKYFLVFACCKVTIPVEKL